MRNKEKYKVGIDEENDPIYMDYHLISWGLFDFTGMNFFWRIPKFFKDLKIYIKRVFYTIRHGYSPVATWEMGVWFASVMREALLEYNKNRIGYPGKYALNEDGSLKEDDSGSIRWGEEVQHAIDLLEEYNKLSTSTWFSLSQKDAKEKEKQMNKCKKEFFKWFSENLEDLWD